MDIQKVLDTIKAKSLEAVKAEFKKLLKSAQKEKVDFIKKSAQQVEQALIYRAEGKLSTEDVITLLKKQKKIAQIEANNTGIVVLAKIQKISYRLLDMAIDVIVKAIVPIV